MSFKDLGPNVSQKPQAVAPGGGQFTAEDHSWESVVLQQDKPATDWEMNLLQEVLGVHGVRRLAQRMLPSCFLSNGFLDRSDVLSGFVFLAPDPVVASTANRFWMKAADLIVNGWTVRFDLTDSATPGVNVVRLPVPPGSGSRTDLVVLEAWRALVSPAPDGTNKSQAGQILRYGNARSPDSGPPGNENLADDLVDPTFAAETARRVQIQYRYRVVPGVNLLAHPDGLEDPAVVAHTTPFLLGSTDADGAASAYAYSRHPDDAGLWVAGENNATGVAALGTVDGLMYAIPLCAVARRNSGAFDRTSNPNGGASMSLPATDRPDGLFSDQITADDVVDLRRGVAWDFSEVLDKTFNEVLDNTLSTSTESVGTGTSLFRVRSLVAQDNVRCTFSDRVVSESVVAQKSVVGATSTVQFNLNAIRARWAAGPVDVTVLAPGAAISDVVSLRLYNQATPVDHDSFPGTGTSPVAVSIVLSASGPTVDTVDITFDVPISNVTVFAEIAIDYPSGSGVGRNMLRAWDFWTPPAASIAAWVDASALSGTSDATRKSLSPSLWWTDGAHREVTARLRTTSQTWDTFADGVTDKVYVPDMIEPGTSPTASGGAVVLGYTQWTPYTAVTVDAVYPLGTPITITYVALRPMPPVAAAPGDSYQLFFQSRAVQSVPVPAGTQTLSLVPRAIGRSIHAITAGSGSPDSGFPFESPGAQIPSGLQPSYPGEAGLTAPVYISSSGLAVASGYLALPVLVPYSPNSGQVTLYSGAADVTTDSDQRNFWPKSDSGASPVYSPVAFGPVLSSPAPHKSALPVLMEVKQDFPSSPPFQFRKGTLVLVVFSRWADYDQEVTVELQSVLSGSCAAVYRVRGNMLNPRRSG